MNEAAVRAVGAVGADEPRANDRPRAEPARTRLGEELPIFCEQCGYALHGLPQARCERCAILQFACPECGHHQPINTLRPAAQRVLGRVRACALALWVFFKANFFFWLLVAWFAAGGEQAYRYNPYRDPTQPNQWKYQLSPQEVNFETAVPFGIFAVLFGMFGRMLLLRWRRGWIVGGGLGALVLLAASLGVWARRIDLRAAPMPPPGMDYMMLLVAAALTVLFGAVIAWPIWLALVHLFLPPRAVTALLDWQRAIPSGAPALARQE